MSYSLEELSALIRSRRADAADDAIRAQLLAEDISPEQIDAGFELASEPLPEPEPRPEDEWVEELTEEETVELKENGDRAAALYLLGLSAVGLVLLIVFGGRYLLTKTLADKLGYADPMENRAAAPAPAPGPQPSAKPL